MQDISKFPHHLDRSKCECKVFIETPKGRRNKFKYKPEAGSFALSHVLPQGFSFPFDFGFIPSTLAEDGDPLDILVLMDEPAHVGCLLDVRLIGVIEVEQIEKGQTSRNDRLIGIAVQSFEFEGVESISQLKPSLVQQLKEFLALYNKNAGKHDEVKGTAGPERALELLEEATANFERKQKESRA